MLTLNVLPCVDNPLTTAQTRLPRKQGEFVPEDNIPRFAIVTGAVDTMECVLRKMGIDDSEFVSGCKTVGVHAADDRPRAALSGDAAHRRQRRPGRAHQRPRRRPTASSGATSARSTAYDIVLFPCTGGEDDKGSTAQNNVITYADAGGRVFTTHFSYVWTLRRSRRGLRQGCTTANQTVAAWNPDTAYNRRSSPASSTRRSPRASRSPVAAAAGGRRSTTLGQIPVNVVRNDSRQRHRAVAAVDLLDAAADAGPLQFPMHYTFNTPVGAQPANQCGRVVFSDFHVENSSTAAGNNTFPTECGGTRR